MNEEIKEMMVEEVKTEIKHLSELAPGSEEKSKAIDVMSKLCRLNHEIVKTDLEFQEKREQREMEQSLRQDDQTIKENQASAENDIREREQALKEEQLKDQIKDRYVRIGIAAAELVIPLVFYGIWMRKGFKFEQTGTYTSSTFRGLFSKFKPTKK